MLFICIIEVFMDVMPENARENPKIMLVETIIVCPIIQKVLFKTQNDQN